MPIPLLREPCPECGARPKHLPDCPVLLEWKRDQDIKRLLIALEFGYKSCEKGHNIQMTVENFLKEIN